MRKKRIRRLPAAKDAHLQDTESSEVTLSEPGLTRLQKSENPQRANTVPSRISIEEVLKTEPVCNIKPTELGKNVSENIKLAGLVAAAEDHVENAEHSKSLIVSHSSSCNIKSKVSKSEISTFAIEKICDLSSGSNSITLADNENLCSASVEDSETALVTKMHEVSDATEKKTDVNVANVRDANVKQNAESDQTESKQDTKSVSQESEKVYEVTMKPSTDSEVDVEKVQSELDVGNESIKCAEVENDSLLASPYRTTLIGFDSKLPCSPDPQNPMLKNLVSPSKLERALLLSDSQPQYFQSKERKSQFQCSVTCPSGLGNNINVQQDVMCGMSGKTSHSTPPLHSTTPPLHNRTPPLHHRIPPLDNTLPLHHSTPPLHPAIPPLHHRTPPMHDTPPLHHSTPPLHHSTPPLHPAFPPLHHRTPPMHDTLPLHHSTPPSHHSSPSLQVDFTAGIEDNLITRPVACTETYTAVKVNIDDLINKSNDSSKCCEDPINVPLSELSSVSQTDIPCSYSKETAVSATKMSTDKLCYPCQSRVYSSNDGNVVNTGDISEEKNFNRNNMLKSDFLNDLVDTEAFKHSKMMSQLTACYQNSFETSNERNQTNFSITKTVSKTADKAYKDYDYHNVSRKYSVVNEGTNQNISSTSCDFSKESGSNLIPEEWNSPECVNQVSKKNSYSESEDPIPVNVSGKSGLSSSDEMLVMHQNENIFPNEVNQERDRTMTCASLPEENYQGQKLNYAFEVRFCDCSVAQEGFDIPVEQVFVLDGQMYQLVDAQIVRIGNLEFYAFFRDCLMHIPLGNFLRVVGKEVESMFKSAVNFENIKLHSLTPDEICLLEQKCGIYCDSMNRDLVNLDTLKEICVQLLNICPENMRLKMLAYSKPCQRVFSEMKCSICGLSKKMSQGATKSYIPMDQTGDNKPKVAATVGTLRIGDENFTAFEMTSKTYISLKEIIQHKLMTLNILCERMKKINSKAHTAPEDIEEYFAMKSHNVCHTLWIDTVTLRCTVCMGSQRKLDSELLVNIRRGEYTYEPNYNLLCEDTSKSENILAVNSNNGELVQGCKKRNVKDEGLPFFLVKRKTSLQVCDKINNKTANNNVSKRLEDSVLENDLEKKEVQEEGSYGDTRSHQMADPLLGGVGCIEMYKNAETDNLKECKKNRSQKQKKVQKIGKMSGRQRKKRVDYACYYFLRSSNNKKNQKECKKAESKRNLNKKLTGRCCSTRQSPEAKTQIVLQPGDYIVSHYEKFSEQLEAGHIVRKDDESGFIGLQSEEKQAAAALESAEEEFMSEIEYDDEESILNRAVYISGISSSCEEKENVQDLKTEFQYLERHNAQNSNIISDVLSTVEDISAAARKKIDTAEKNEVFNKKWDCSEIDETKQTKESVSDPEAVKTSLLCSEIMLQKLIGSYTILDSDTLKEFRSMSTTVSPNKNNDCIDMETVGDCEAHEDCKAQENVDLVDKELNYLQTDIETDAENGSNFESKMHQKSKDYLISADIETDAENGSNFESKMHQKSKDYLISAKEISENLIINKKPAKKESTQCQEEIEMARTGFEAVQDVESNENVNSTEFVTSTDKETVDNLIIHEKPVSKEDSLCQKGTEFEREEYETVQYGKDLSTVDDNENAYSAEIVQTAKTGSAEKLKMHTKLVCKDDCLFQKGNGMENKENESVRERLNFVGDHENVSDIVSEFKKEFPENFIMNEKSASKENSLVQKSNEDKDFATIQDGKRLDTDEDHEGITEIVSEVKKENAENLIIYEKPAGKKNILVQDESVIDTKKIEAIQVDEMVECAEDYGNVNSTEVSKVKTEIVTCDEIKNIDEHPVTITDDKDDIEEVTYDKEDTSQEVENIAQENQHCSDTTKNVTLEGDTDECEEMKSESYISSDNRLEKSSDEMRREMEDNIKKYLVFMYIKEGSRTGFRVLRFKNGAEKVFPALFLPDPEHPVTKCKRIEFMKAAAKYMDDLFSHHKQKLLEKREGKPESNHLGSVMEMDISSNCEKHEKCRSITDDKRENSSNYIESKGAKDEDLNKSSESTDGKGEESSSSGQFINRKEEKSVHLENIEDRGLNVSDNLINAKHEKVEVLKSGSNDIDETEECLIIDCGKDSLETECNTDTCSTVRTDTEAEADDSNTDMHEKGDNLKLLQKNVEYISDTEERIDASMCKIEHETGVDMDIQCKNENFAADEDKFESSNKTESLTSKNGRSSADRVSNFSRQRKSRKREITTQDTKTTSPKQLKLDNDKSTAETNVDTGGERRLTRSRKGNDSKESERKGTSNHIVKISAQGEGKKGYNNKEMDNLEPGVSNQTTVLDIGVNKELKKCHKLKGRNRTRNHIKDKHFEGQLLQTGYTNDADRDAFTVKTLRENGNTARSALVMTLKRSKEKEMIVGQEKSHVSDCYVRLKKIKLLDDAVSS